jgi:hypothetical protein
VFQVRGIRNRHQKEHYYEYGCNMCDKLFTRKETLLDHMKVKHTEDGGRPCPICKQILRGKNRFNYHFKKCSKVGKKNN